jgi:hypothetical protein
VLYVVGNGNENQLTSRNENYVIPPFSVQNSLSLLVFDKRIEIETISIILALMHILAFHLLRFVAVVTSLNRFFTL